MEMDFGNMCNGSESGKLGGGIAGAATGFLLGGPVGAAIGLFVGQRAGKKLSTMHHSCPKCGHVE